MSAAHMLLELVNQLDRLWVEPSHVSVEELAQLLAKRQHLLTDIQKADISALDPATRIAIVKKIEGVRERDARLRTMLAAEHAEVAQALGEMTQARSAVRGYQATTEPPPSGLKRIA